jgi:hypothetical protein
MKTTRACFLLACAVSCGCASDPLPGGEAGSANGDVHRGADLGESPDLSQTADLTASIDFALSCVGLDEATCRTRPQCVPDYCQGCECETAFVGCRAPGDPVTPCPGTGCAKAPHCCRSDQDCTVVGQHCVAPGEVLCGGPACPRDPQPGACNTDADCQRSGGVGPAICVASPCCSYSYCTAGCTSDADCGDGATCGADAHCRPIPCTTTADCPPDFECPETQPDVIYCTRKACQSDADCSGYCVDGECHGGKLGVCGFLPV